MGTWTAVKWVAGYFGIGFLFDLLFWLYMFVFDDDPGFAGCLFLVAFLVAWPIAVPGFIGLVLMVWVQDREFPLKRHR